VKAFLSVRLDRARVFILAFALAGCSVEPTYHHPDMPMPTAWRNTAPASPDWPRVEWWQDFGSTQLDDFMAQAKAGNDDIAAAIARVRQAALFRAVPRAPLSIMNTHPS
jgi:multidrug efflux system outer membrane protein